jgi:hypothetical protein
MSQLLIGVFTTARAEFKRSVLDRSASFGLIIKIKRTVVDFFTRDRASINKTPKDGKELGSVHDFLG